MHQAVVKGFASSHLHSKSMTLELLAHFTDEETEAMMVTSLPSIHTSERHHHQRTGIHPHRL